MPAEFPQSYPESPRKNIEHILNFNTLEGLIKEGQLQYIEPSTLWSLIQVESGGKLEAKNADSYWLGQITSMAIADIIKFRASLPPNMIKHIENLLSLMKISWNELKDNPQILTQIEGIKSSTNQTILSLLLTIAYLKIIESRYLPWQKEEFGDRNTRLQAFKQSQELKDFLASRYNLRWEFNEKNFNELIDEIIQYEELFNRFLVLRRYNAWTKLIDESNKVQYKDAYALWILYHEKTKERIIENTKEETQKVKEEVQSDFESFTQQAKGAKYVTLTKPSYIYRQEWDKLVNLGLRPQWRRFEIDKTQESVIKKGKHYFLRVISYDGKLYLLQISKRDKFGENLSLEETILSTKNFPEAIKEILSKEKKIVLLKPTYVFAKQGDKFINLWPRAAHREFLLPSKIQIIHEPLTQKNLLKVISPQNHKTYWIDMWTATNLNIIWVHLYEELKKLANKKQFDLQAPWDLQKILQIIPETDFVASTKLPPFPSFLDIPPQQPK